MTDRRHQDSGEQSAPVPRDMPDQQARGDEDRWDARPVRSGKDESAADVPDTDEAGTGRQGMPRKGGVHPDTPVPDEPPG